MLLRSLAAVLVATASLSAPSAAAPSAVPSAQASTPRLEDSRPCPGLTGVTCAYLSVPLDRSGKVPGTVRLKVATSDAATAPKGVLLLLAGGPGQPGVPYFGPLSDSLKNVVDDYRLVMLDQRGTGDAAIDCPRLQKETGGDDILPPSREAVEECSAILGETRHHYTTADTVADLDDLRAALGVGSWTLDGVSYGTFVAQQYALTHPAKVRRLVLDSVVPQDNIDPFIKSAMRHSGTVLRLACKEQQCGFDPAAALARTVRRYDNGVSVLQVLTILSIIDPQHTRFGALDALRKAAAGDPADLGALIAAFSEGGASAGELSAGLHYATLCADVTKAPWGDSSAPLDGREEALRRAVHRQSSVWPFERKTVAEHGYVQACLRWPPSRPMPQAPARTLTMPVLLLHGDRDLSTPVAWAIEQAARTPRGRLVVVKGAGHSVQRRHPEGAAAVERFLTGSGT
ncbi:alpha/beta fold hydrolase [Nonomuraea sp. NPDC049480]|uniref:alpha/beta hydrolase n=1 Tax=Nonomuraea sp. NPDC049480 TaxID=3364353 RepID=UPI00379D08F9